MSSTFYEELKPLILLGGLNAQELWPALNIVLLSYAILIFAPQWKWTPSLTLVTPVFHSVIYVGALFSPMIDPTIESKPVDALSLEGVAALLSDPNVVFPAWTHYIVFDFLVARMEVFDSIERGASTAFHFLAVVPCVFFTFMVGPTGFLMYMILREIFLPKGSTGEKSGSKKML
jgi:Domain of unknown function (DUF4281)